MRSVVPVAEPLGVSTTTGPDPTTGACIVSEVAVAPLAMAAKRPLTKTLLFTGSKFDPVMVTGVAGVSALFEILYSGGSINVGEKPLMAGAAFVETVNDPALEHDGVALEQVLLPTFTLTGPVVAPTGTATVIACAVTALGVAKVPLKVTVTPETNVPNPLPAIVMVVPTGARFGLNC